VICFDLVLLTLSSVACSHCIAPTSVGYTSATVPSINHLHDELSDVDVFRFMPVNCLFFFCFVPQSFAAK